MSRRRLTPEEQDLWRKVTENTHRMQHRPAATEMFDPKPADAKPARRKIEEFSLGQKAQTAPLLNNLSPSLSEHLHQSPVQMDRKAFGKMKRGKMGPEARIDLHGMTVDRAHPALTRFILSAHGSGKRLVLVITGKGKSKADDGPIPTRMGVLKHQVPQWLKLPPLAQAVLQVTPAHISHGGTGAYYVYLRKKR